MDHGYKTTSANLHGITIANQKKWPYLFGYLAEDNNKEEVKHNSFTEHPAERRQKEVVE